MKITKWETLRNFTDLLILKISRAKIMARLTGLEPATQGLGIPCSISKQTFLINPCGHGVDKMTQFK